MLARPRALLCAANTPSRTHQTTLSSTARLFEHGAGVLLGYHPVREAFRVDLRERSSSVERHPWEVARYDFFSGLLRETRPLAGARVLDVGSGDAWFARRLWTEEGPAATCCVDASYTDADREELGRAAPGVRFVTAPPAERFDVVLLLDVVEHVRDDVGFVRGLVDEQLAERGLVVVSVPAWPALWTSHDVALGHHRRYTPQQARAVLEGAGLRILRSGSVFASLPLPRAIAALRERSSPPRPNAIAPHSGWSAPRALTRIVGAALAVDVAIARFAARHEVAIPGLSCWALCERREPRA